LIDRSTIFTKPIARVRIITAQDKEKVCQRFRKSWKCREVLQKYNLSWKDIWKGQEIYVPLEAKEVMYYLRQMTESAYENMKMTESAHIS
jgi:hypothetical protein